MFDLIDECGADLGAHGYTIKQLGKFAITVANLFVDGEEKSKALGLAEGKYYMFISPFLHQLGVENERYLSSLLAEKIKTLLRSKGVKKSDRILLACLGNFDIAADSLGKVVFDNFEITSHKKNNNLFKFCPNIFLYTGVETKEVISLLCTHLKIKCVIIIDSLTTSSLSRLGVSFQLSSAGMTPGSGVNRFGRPIDEKSVGCHCVSIGVPFMISSQALKQGGLEEVILVSKDVEEDIKRAGGVIATALGQVLL